MGACYLGEEFEKAKSDLMSFTLEMFIAPPRFLLSSQGDFFLFFFFFLSYDRTLFFRLSLPFFSLHRYSEAFCAVSDRTLASFYGPDDRDYFRFLLMYRVHWPHFFSPGFNLCKRISSLLLLSYTRLMVFTGRRRRLRKGSFTFVRSFMSLRSDAVL